jgi:electron transfer flavoprotein beta subunit
MGADNTILLSDRAFAGADTLATSYTLAMAIKKIGYKIPVDLVLCGKQAIDGDTAQTGPGIATRLKYTQLTYVSQIQWVDPAKRKIQVKRKLDDEIQVITGELPALLTVELELARPRRAPLPALIASLKAPVQIWDAKEIEAVETMLGIKGSPTWVRRISSPAPRHGGAKFNAGADPEKAVAQCLEVLFEDDAFLLNFKQTSDLNSDVKKF